MRVKNKALEDLPSITAFFVCLFSVLTSLLLLSLQPCLNIAVRKCKSLIGLQASYQFPNILNIFAVPYTALEVALVSVNVLVIVMLFLLTIRYCTSIKSVAIIFPAGFFAIHLIWFFIFNDGFIPLNCMVSSLLIGLYLSLYQPIKFNIDNLSDRLITALIQGKIDHIKLLIKIILTVALAITGSTVAFNYVYMEKLFHLAGDGKYELALYSAQRQIASIMIWNVLAFLGFVLPKLYNRIGDVLNIILTKSKTTH